MLYLNAHVLPLVVLVLQLLSPVWVCGIAVKMTWCCFCSGVVLL
jgi:hypothetical protein